MRPPSLHSHFFSSLKQVEKRLKLENPPPPQERQKSMLETNCSSTESLSTPLHLHIDQEPGNGNVSTTLHDSSEPPLAFLSCSPQPSPTDQNPLQESVQCKQKTFSESEISDFDSIEQLMRLLGLSDCGIQGGENERGFGDGECCGCDEVFYEKIVGIKLPKCKKEVERLDRWIRCFLGNDGGKEERREPLRLAFLLLGKAAYEAQIGGREGFGGLEFPTTIEEFLKFDPPTQC